MKKSIGAILSVVLGVAVVGGVLLALGNLGRAQPAAHAQNAGTTYSDQGTQVNHAHLTLQTFPFSPYTDPDWVSKHVTGKTDNGIPFPAAGDNQGWVLYWPTTTLVVPAHSLVTIDIQNYDSATPLLNSYYSVPRGVVNNSVMVDGQETASVSPENVSHTFTIHSIPNANQPWLFVSVPVTGAPPACDPSDTSVKPPDCVNADDAGMPDQPTVTEFSFYTGDPGTYIWQCFDPCGANYNGFGGPMSTKGYMSGTITVQ
jgi:hypothetical protein